jgi:cysteine desulfurase
MSRYFDYAAATPVCKEALIAMQPYFSDKFYNPSAMYLTSRRVRDDIEESRSKVAQLLGCRPGEIIFTAGGTEANNIAVHGIMARFPGKKLLVSAIEHEAVLGPANAYNSSRVSVNEKAEINLNDLKSKIDDDVVLISIMYANNEVGTIQPITEISEVVKSVNLDRKKRGVNLPLYFHTDACQAASHLDLHVSRLGVDLMTVNGGKIYGPKQSGILYVKAGIALNNFISGGGQERGVRSGTENTAGIIGFASALGIARSKAISEKKRLEKLQAECIKNLKSTIPEVVFFGHLKKRLPHNVSFAVPGVDNERLMMLLDEKGYQVATGSACQAASTEPSHVLRAMGVNDELANSSIRLSFGRDTNQGDINGLISTIKTAILDIKNL